MVGKSVATGDLVVLDIDVLQIACSVSEDCVSGAFRSVDSRPLVTKKKSCFGSCVSASKYYGRLKCDLCKRAPIYVTLPFSHESSVAMFEHRACLKSSNKMKEGKRRE